MKNFDIILLNLVVILCFIAFIISTFKAFEKASKTDFISEKRGIISRFLAYLESLVNE